VIADPSTAIIRILDDDALPFVSIQSPTPSSTFGRSSNNQFDLSNKSGSQGIRNAKTAGSSDLKVFELKLRNSGRTRADQNQERMANIDDEFKQQQMIEENSSCGSADDQTSCASNNEINEQVEERLTTEATDSDVEETHAADPINNEAEPDIQTEHSGNPPPAAESASINSDQF
jgi:hypothetical protein